MRTRLLKLLYKCLPFDLKGDCNVPPAADGLRISCLINFYGRLDLLNGILQSLSQQDFHKDNFEVILVEDRGGTDPGRKLAEEFSDRLQIRYSPLDNNFGLMGYSRNYALSRSRGDFILFLDDDTVILQKDFLRILFDLFSKNGAVDAILPHGMASYSLIEGKYGFHDPYYMTSRCTAYRRSTLAELGGFVSSFIGQEDVEFSLRFLSAGKKSIKTPELEYYHPPLLIDNLNKPKAVGRSFFDIRNRYPFFVWLMIVVNCGRHFPLIFSPIRKHREMGRFGVGFILGVITGSFKRSGLHYS